MGFRTRMGLDTSRPTLWKSRSGLFLDSYLCESLIPAPSFFLVLAISLERLNLSPCPFFEFACRIADSRLVMDDYKQLIAACD